MDIVQVPEQVVNKDGKDVLEPLKATLTGLNILPADGALAKSGASATFTGPPDSVSIIEAGATAFSKWWAAAVSALGGTAVISAAATGFWRGQTGGTRIALVGGLAAVLVAVILAVALIVSADVRGRAQGASAQYYARASVAGEFLRISQLASRPPAEEAQLASKPKVHGNAKPTPASAAIDKSADELLQDLIRFMIARGSAKPKK
jgi:hypothetical protein